MSMTQTTTDITPTGESHCQHCGTQLPPQAAFCASCGERIQKKHVDALLQDTRDIATRYRITSLVRRRPYVSLFLATDTEQQRPVALRDIDTTSLNDGARLTASTTVQREYDLLRRQHIPHVIPLLDLRHFEGHFYVVAGWPRDERGAQNHLRTLQDILQSGNGLPDEAQALNWIAQLCLSLHDLHTSDIIVADLDPQTIILNGDTYDSEMALMVSWLPSTLRGLFPRTSVIANTTNYTAPEVLLGRPEPRSDIYSLGALLYLLLTGTPPEEPTQRSHRRLRMPSELNARVNGALDDFVMQALAIDAADRFSSTATMREALLQLRSGAKRSNATKDLARKNKNGHNAPVSNPTSTTGNSNTNTIGSNSDSLSTAETIVESGPTSVQEPSAHSEANNSSEQQREAIIATDTVLMTPLPVKERVTWQTNATAIPAIPATPLNDDIASAETIVVTPHPVEPVEPDERDIAEENDDINDARDLNAQASVPEPPTRSVDVPLSQRFKRRITGFLPAIPSSLLPKAPEAPETPTPSVAPVDSMEPPVATDNIASASDALVPVKSAQPPAIRAKRAPETPAPVGNASLLQRLQHLLLGEQKQTMTAAAMIETPMRVQPNQNYHIRIHVMGRGTPMPAPDSKDGAIAGGLSSLVEGDIVSIEVRSALYQNFAYIVQRATVQIPENGFAAEVTIPMQPLTSGPSGRRDRLHIFFMDEKRRSLYEKPFVIELFISHLVQPGREGHNVLTIPF